MRFIKTVMGITALLVMSTVIASTTFMKRIRKSRKDPEYIVDHHENIEEGLI